MDGRTVRPTKQQCKGPLMALFKEITTPLFVWARAVIQVRLLTLFIVAAVKVVRRE